MNVPRSVCMAVLLTATVAPMVSAHAGQTDVPPLTVGGGWVDPAAFRVTVFASGLFYPYGMTELEDGSLLVGTSNPTDGGYYASTGQLVRLVDEGADGVADGVGEILIADLPGALTAVRRAGSLVFAASVQPGSEQISVLRTGTMPADPLTPVGSINFGYAEPMDHGTYGLAISPEPGRQGRFHLFFNVGSIANDAAGGVVEVSGLVSGTLADAAIYRVTVDDTGDAPVFSDLIQIASGLRNAAGLVVDPATGDLYFEDNGIDTPDDRIVALSADELNRIPAAEVGGAVEDFGFPHSYVDYHTGEQVGEGGVDPLAAFLPLNGHENEGAAEVALAPPGFPDGFNHGVFVGFHGQWDEVGLPNEENPLLYVDLGTGEQVHFVGNDEAAVGHLDGLLATRDALYVADLTGTGSLVGGEASGVIYRIESAA